MNEPEKPPKKRRPKGVPEASSSASLARMQHQAREATAAEATLGAALRERGLPFEVQKQVLPQFRRRADFVFAATKVAVMVDGCFWHACPIHATWPKANAEWWRAKIEANQRRDRATNDALVAAGWAVVRVWEHEPPEAAAARIVEVVDRRAGDDEPEGELVEAP